MKKFEKPIVLCFTKEDLDNYVLASASCIQSLCSQGSSYTCGSSISYTCTTSNHSSCAEGNTFTCGKKNNHIDDIEEWI